MVSTYLWKHRRGFAVPGILAFFFLLTTPAGAQEQGYTPDSLFIALFSNGDALVEYDVRISDPLSEEVKIQLFGDNISDLIVVDFEDNLVDFEVGSTPNEITLNTPGVSNVRISYTTPDFVNKIRNEWFFALNSTIDFSVKLPSDSVLIDPGENPPFIVTVGDQQLLTFRPGDIQISYVIGVLGTEEQANIVIRAAEATIREIEDRNDGIVLARAQELLDGAVAARDAGRFADAERLADQSNDAAIAADRDFAAAQGAIASAGDLIEQADGQGRDTTAAKQLLAQANSEFADGNYVAARNSADSVAAAIADRAAEPAIPVFVVIAIVGAAGGVGALVALRMRKPKAAVEPRPVMPKEPARAEVPRPAVVEKAEEIEEEEPEEDLQQQDEPALPLPPIIPDSKVDRSILSRIVGKILEEKPHLRPEDQQVLHFLAEKEGAAFESEIRSKFQLPKTTIWRLVKRLEREELVEIRKAGGQNLIKLRFEERQP
jgi:uncharacterized membrane protein